MNGDTCSNEYKFQSDLGLIIRIIRSSKLEVWRRGNFSKLIKNISNVSEKLREEEQLLSELEQNLSTVQKLRFIVANEKETHDQKLNEIFTSMHKIHEDFVTREGIIGVNLNK